MIINFHHFHNNNIPKYVQGSISEYDFEQFIKNNKHKIIDIDIWLDKYKKENLKNEIAITLDDGLLCQYDIALPILDKYKIKAGWGIYTDPLNNNTVFLEVYKYFQGLFFDKDDDFYELFFNELSINFKEYNKINNKNILEYRKHLDFYTFNDRKFRYIRDMLPNTIFERIINNMILKKKCNIDTFKNKIWINKDQLKILKQTQYICSHSISHPINFDKLKYNIQEKEIKESINYLEDFLNCKINIFCCPCDNYNNDTIDIINKLNIYCFIGKQQIKEKKQTKDIINRIDINDYLNINIKIH